MAESRVLRKCHPSLEKWEQRNNRPAYGVVYGKTCNNKTPLGTGKKEEATGEGRGGRRFVNLPPSRFLPGQPQGLAPGLQQASGDLPGLLLQSRG